MNPRRILGYAVISIAFALCVAGTVAHADEFDQAMKLTFSQPVQIPNHVLPAGTYWFQVPNHGENATENLIRVFDGEHKTVIATMAVQSHQATNPDGKTSGHIVITMANRSPKPAALLSLTYPGRIEGSTLEVSYPKQEQSSFSEYPKVTMTVGENGVLTSSESDAR